MRSRFAAVWAVCTGLILCGAASVLFVLHGALEPADRLTLLRMLAANVTVLVILLIFTCVISAWIANWVMQHYVKPLHRYADGIGLIAAGNPAYRVEAAPPAELRIVATAINALAARHEATLRDVTARVHEAQSNLELEKSHLATLMSELAQSVVVCNAQGEILLYNEKARHLFSSVHESTDEKAMPFLGLGRSIYALADHGAVRAGLDELRQRLASNVPNPVADFTMQLANGKIAHARMAPARHQATASPTPATEIDGFVLLLTAVNAEHEARPSRHSETFAPTGRPVYYDFDLFHQAGQTKEIEDRPLSKIVYTAFDTETTGLEPSSGDEIIAIGAIRLVNGRLLHQEQFSKLIDPRRPLSPESIAIHGITPEMLRGKPTIEKVIPAFYQFCEDTVLLGHNAAFDMRFLEIKQRQTGIKFTQPVLDTLLLSAVLHGTLQAHGLDAIALRLGVAVVDRHSAIGDAVTTAQIFLKLLPLLSQRGIVTLRQAREASATTSYARLRY
ncbi:MAG: exonuclease domain-containing protein [Burkholderiales bacterium]